MSARILVVDDSPTIRKVVASILEARAYEPVLAADGQEALDLLSTERVDLVLLDFVMPRMNGYQFCRELRAHPQYKNLPVVLMSAKSDKIRGQFVLQTGAIDAITKPFDARGLVAVVEGALKKQEEGRARPVPTAEAMPAEDSSLENNQRPSRTSSDDVGLRRIQAVGEFVSALEGIVLPELELELNAGRRRPEDIGRALERAITPEALGALSTLIRSLHFGENTREVLAGDISVISIAEVLQMLDLQRQSGALSIFTRKDKITLFIRNGNVDLAVSRGLRGEFRLGRYLVEGAAISRERLESAVEGRVGKRLIGETLAELGLVSREQLHRALVRQTSELMFEVVRWNAGRFSFTVGGESALARRAALDLETSALVMEGFRRVDEWRLIEGSFDFDEVLFPDPVAIERINDASLTRQERQVLGRIDGERTIREIVGGMEGSSFEVCKILFQFLNSRLVRRKGA